MDNSLTIYINDIEVLGETVISLNLSESIYSIFPFITLVYEDVGLITERTNLNTATVTITIKDRFGIKTVPGIEFMVMSYGISKQVNKDTDISEVTINGIVKSNIFDERWSYFSGSGIDVLKSIYNKIFDKPNIKESLSISEGLILDAISAFTTEDDSSDNQIWCFPGVKNNLEFLKRVILGCFKENDSMVTYMDRSGIINLAALSVLYDKLTVATLIDAHIMSELMDKLTKGEDVTTDYVVIKNVVGLDNTVEKHNSLFNTMYEYNRDKREFRSFDVDGHPVYNTGIMYNITGNHSTEYARAIYNNTVLPDILYNDFCSVTVDYFDKIKLGTTVELNVNVAGIGQSYLAGKYLVMNIETNIVGFGYPQMTLGLVRPKGE